jgi:putative transcriptional regulator
VIIDAPSSAIHNIRVKHKQPLPGVDVQNKVRDFRIAAGMSQGELATALEVSRQTIQSIEVGRYLPSLPLALALGRYFRRPVEEIFDPCGGPSSVMDAGGPQSTKFPDLATGAAEGR